MDWVNTVPKITIREGQIQDVKIVKDNNWYILYVGNQQWNMVHTASTFSLREWYSSYDLAEGNVLLSGFGFGILPQWIASKSNVTSVTVVEKYKEVVDLFDRHNILNPKITIVFDDIHTFKSEQIFDWAIYDHYELNIRPNKKELKELENNLTYTNLWFWSLEYRLSEHSNWQDFRNDYSLKIPDLSPEILERYTKTVSKEMGLYLR